MTEALARNIIDHARSGLGRQAIRQEVDVGGSVVDAVVRAWEAAGKPDDPAAVIADLLERRRVGLAREVSGKPMEDREAKIAQAKRLRQDGMSVSAIAKQLGVSTGWISSVTRQAKP